MKKNIPRYFEVKMKNGQVGVLSEDEIKKYKNCIAEKRDEFIWEVADAIGELTEDNKLTLGIK